MARFKITPTCLRTGNTAPYFVVDCDENEVEKIAPTLSHLFELPKTSKGMWEPSIDKLVTKKRD
jgi:hypothetical protein